MKNANRHPVLATRRAAGLPDGVHGPARRRPARRRTAPASWSTPSASSSRVSSWSTPGWPGSSPSDRPTTASLVERALRIGLARAPGRRRDGERGCGPARVRGAPEPDRPGQRARRRGALDQVLRQNFADGDGRLPRTLETFLGRSRPAPAVRRRSCSTRRSGTARSAGCATLLGTYFDGDASRLAMLLDPTRMHSPLHQFRVEVTRRVRQAQRPAHGDRGRRRRARAAERAKSAAKGADFEDLLEAMLGDIARGAGDLVDRTGTEAGDVIRSKKGDFVLTVNPAQTARRGAADRRRGQGPGDVRPRRCATSSARRKTNRGAAVGLVVFTPAHAPAGIAPFDVRARRRLLRRRPRGPGRGRARGGRPAGPAAGPASACATARSRSTRRRSGQALDGDPRAARADPGRSSRS